MTITYGLLSLILSFVSALYLQLPTFILSLGYGWSHNYPLKRWVLRIAALIAFLFFVIADPELSTLLAVGIPFTFVWVFSLFNAYKNVFIALNDTQIIKQEETVYSNDTEVVGYIDEAGNAICYPIHEMVMPRDILNDTFCERPLLVSFCAGCRSAMLYNPVIDGQRLTFEVIGVHRRNMIMRDTQTGTVWQQATGQAMYGKLKGKKLEFHWYQQTTLTDWLKQNPNSFIAKEGDNIRKSVVPKVRLLKVLLKISENIIAPGKTGLTGLSVREKIWGLQLNGQSKAYPISELKKAAEITDNIGGVEIQIKYNPSSNQILGFVTRSNERLKFQNRWWFGWKEFHPDTEIWKAR